MAELAGRIAIIDDDPTILVATSRALRDAGFGPIDEFSEGEKAWAAIQKERYALIILDWKLGDVRGIALLNRLRQERNHQFAPVVVVSGFLKTKDFSLLEEFPFTGLLEKPAGPQFMVRKIRELIREQQWFEHQKTALQGIAQSLSFDPDGATQLIRALIEEAPKPVPIALAAARQLSASGLFDHAEGILRDLLKLVPDCLLAMNELGKVLLRKKKLSEAAYVLRRAQSLSPENIERLCLLGDVSLQMFETQQAEEYFSAARAIDDRSEKAKAGLTLAKNVDQYLCRSNVSSIPESFAGLLNAIGITLVRSERFAEGMEHYRSAMKYVSDDDSRAKLAYNLGLGFVRWGKPVEALPWFQRSVEYSSGGFEKAQRQVRALQQGVDVPRTAAAQRPVVAIAEGGFGRDFDIEFSEDINELEVVNAGDPAEIPPPGFRLEGLSTAKKSAVDDRSRSSGVTVAFEEDDDEREDDLGDGERLLESGGESKVAWFERTFPKGKGFLELLLEKHEDIDSSISKVVGLVDEFGDEAVADALSDAIRRRNSSVYGLKKRLTKKAS